MPGMKIVLHVVHHLGPALERKLDWGLNALLRKGDRIMTAIAEFSEQMKAFFDRQDAAVSDLQADVKFLKDKIAELQNSPGEITPEDQALLDALEERANATAGRLEALSQETPPAVPAA